MAQSKTQTSSARPDFATIGGLILALGGIAAGLLMEGGKLQDIAQVTSALIVLGGTLGAVMITTPLPVLLRAAKQFSSVILGRVPATDEIVEEIIGYAVQARKNGIVSLEQEAAAIGDPFLRKALGLAVDGIESDKIRDIMELEIEIFEQRSEAEAKVFEAAGGYAPTIGIIGAVLGLIQVMKSLADIDEVGRGIAVAFVATIYGVGLANLFFLPSSGKIKMRIREEQITREMTLEGVISILEGMNPRMLETKLKGFLAEEHEKAK